MDEYEYRRVADEEDCRQKARAKGYNQLGSYGNTYNFCMVSWVNGKVEDKGTKAVVASWAARVTIVVHTYVGFQGAQVTAARGYSAAKSRDIKARIVVDQVNCVGLPENCNPRVYLNLNSGGQCTSDHSQGEMKALRSWNNTRTDITVKSDPIPGSGGPAKTTQCAFWPIVQSPDSDDKANKVMTVTPQYFRCDSSTRIMYYNSGCVLWNPRPVWVLDGNDSTVEKTAEHINTALTNPQATQPLTPGKTKVFPGSYKAPTSNPMCTTDQPFECLTRTTDKTVKTGLIDLNRDAARAACRVVNGGKRWRKPNSCDEYPFASTYQGVSKAGINYSVSLHDIDDNCTAGRRLGGFYAYNRVLDRDAFWVWAVKKGEAVPPGLEEDARQVPIPLPPCDDQPDEEPTL
ncbi:hypothetical protein AB0K40_43355 [Nonomuraea bangladeshensis]|uniref:Deoxyribonuclease NucA/NucB domain-containing protein n=1 Tax=Nonomuraea bangladeshensis TaxID=404385 RepID=A0ABV3HIK7_9ACTN